jgi:hypothetical protein
VQRAERMADGQLERFVLDLSGLRFIDCCGARALAAVTRAVPRDCPVIVRAVRPGVRRVLELLGLDLQRQPRRDGPAREHRTTHAGAHDADRQVRQLQVTRTRAQHVMAEARMLAAVMAATEDQVAVTLARLAERRPDRADRLRHLSEDARREAIHLRDRAKMASLPGPAVISAGAGTRSRDTAAVPAERGVISASETRDCEQCGAVFIPRREHARFCSSSCRDSWDRDRGGDPRAGASALSWTVTAMRNVTEWLAEAAAQDKVHAFEAIGDAVWWVTIVDATLYRHHLEAYENVMRAQPAAERQLIAATLGGLRFVRNQMGSHVGHADFIEPARGRPGHDDDVITTWWWRSLPEPTLAWLPPRGQAWEMTRYRAYQAQLAGHSIGETFGLAAAFLKLASAMATRRSSGKPSGGGPRPGTRQAWRTSTRFGADTTARSGKKILMIPNGPWFYGPGLVAGAADGWSRISAFTLARCLDYLILRAYALVAVDEPAGGCCAPGWRSQPGEMTDRSARGPCCRLPGGGPSGPPGGRGPRRVPTPPALRGPVNRLFRRQQQRALSSPAARDGTNGLCGIRQVVRQRVGGTY